MAENKKSGRFEWGKNKPNKEEVFNEIVTKFDNLLNYVCLFYDFECDMCAFNEICDRFVEVKHKLITGEDYETSFEIE